MRENELRGVPKTEVFPGGTSAKVKKREGTMRGEQGRKKGDSGWRNGKIVWKIGGKVSFHRAIVLSGETFLPLSDGTANALQDGDGEE